MSRFVAYRALSISKQIQRDADSQWRPPSEGITPHNDLVLPSSLFRGTRHYLVRIADEVNATYACGAYDACAVMIRRIVETLIIEVYESHQCTSQIKNNQGDFVYLDDLINRFLQSDQWNVGRNTKRGLPRLKNAGDWSAHNRRYLAQRQDIDKLIDDLRVSAQELLLLAKLK